MKTYIVYKITNKKNGKSYIGKTEYSLKHRWNRHLSSARNGSKFRFHSAIRKYGEDWGKENKVGSAIQRLNVGKFRLRLEKGEVDKEILGNLPSKGSEIMITEDYTPRKDNSKILEINPQAAQDYQTGKIYVNPIDKQFYIVQGEGNKKTFVGIGKYY